MSWYLDDFPALELLPRERRHGLGRRPLFARWKDAVRLRLRAGARAGCSRSTVHPQTIGRAHAFVMFERFVEYVAGHDGVWITTLGEIASTWRDVDES